MAAPKGSTSIHLTLFLSMYQYQVSYLEPQVAPVNRIGHREVLLSHFLDGVLAHTGPQVLEDNDKNEHTNTCMSTST